LKPTKRCRGGSPLRSPPSICTKIPSSFRRAANHFGTKSGQNNLPIARSLKTLPAAKKLYKKSSPNETSPNIPLTRSSLPIAMPLQPPAFCSTS
jgi:hypothetical protein